MDVCYNVRNAYIDEAVDAMLSCMMGIFVWLQGGDNYIALQVPRYLPHL